MAEFTPSPEELQLEDDGDGDGVKAGGAGAEEGAGRGADAIMDNAEQQNGDDGRDPSPVPDRSASGVDGAVLDDEPMEDGVDDLFGEDEDVKASRTKRRTIDDEELDSGDDDEGRDDRMEDGVEEEAEGYEQKEISVTSISLGRQGLPKGNDGELYLLRNPNFIGIEPKGFDFKTFTPPTTSHHSADPPPATFSAAQTANNTIRWRRSPNDPSKLQSNSRIIRWSDGSLTLQIASNAMEQHELPAKPLAPPQYRPAKPTPTSMNSKAPQGPPKYDHRLDSHTYLATVHTNVSFAKVQAHITASLAVQATTDDNDDALLRLQEKMALAVKGGKKDGAANGPGVIHVTEDPELAKKKAEIAEREKMRAQKRRQNQEERERDRANRVLGRSGLRTGMGAGLTVGALEDEDGTGMGSARPRAKAPRKPKRRRNSEYSEEESDYRRGKTKEDEYDQDDGFLVASDEEPEIVEDDEDDEEDLGDDLDDEAEEKPQKSTGQAKRQDKAQEVAAVRGKRRRVVDDDDGDDDDHDGGEEEDG